ncbi:MAG: response regulator [Nanoarchaeota archaeon]
MPKILLVDDGAKVVYKQALEYILGKDRLSIDEASDGTEAINYIKNTYPDLALMDIQMPRMNGIKAAKEMRALGYNGPIIIWSSDRVTIEFLRRNGDQTIEYLVKGDLEALRQALTTKLKAPPKKEN